MSGLLAGKHIVLGVTGSIAAYKSAVLVRRLQDAGAEVQVVMTTDATQFVTPLTFSTLSKRPVFLDLHHGGPVWSEHVALGRWADLILIAPCTANTLAKLANGLCDNALLAVTLSAACPVLVAPAMDHEMMLHPATQSNLQRIKQLGYQIAESDTGYLASGIVGQGRMAEPETLVETVVRALSPQLLRGQKVLIDAGPTREAIDPVRFISNHSTGKMGIALALAAVRHGAEVTLVAGPLQVPVPTGMRHVAVESAADMHQAVMAELPQHDIVILTAAVSDYKPETAANQKIKKNGDGGMVLQLTQTQDILADVGARKRADQFLVGFALETHDELRHAQEKARRKNTDMLVLNSLRDAGAGFGTDTNRVTLLFRNGEQHQTGLLSKYDVAVDILHHIAHIQRTHEDAKN